ncbi:MAG TPA: hypothetical protein VEK11_26180 [Thermoanaerobaculia bacterium]|nr:hypothetical protein [Thermoanaerobaculia bacterium]
MMKTKTGFALVLIGAAGDAMAAPWSPEDWWPVITGAVIAAVLMLLTVAGFVLRIREFNGVLAQVITRVEQRGNNDRVPKDRGKRDDGAEVKELRREIQALQTSVRNLPADIERRLRPLLAEAPQQQPQRPRTAVPPVRDYDEPCEEPRVLEDTPAQLLSIANQIVRQSSTLDAFRASTSKLPVRVSPWPEPSDGMPAAFIVEYRGSCYAVPNAVKPARLPQDWFNRSEFGVNDEIHRVESLPRLRRRGDAFDVEERGVFVR